MKARILIRKKIKASSIQEGMKIIKAKYPRAKAITYEFDEDYRYTRNNDYANRTMKIAFVDDSKKVFLE